MAHSQLILHVAMCDDRMLRGAAASDSGVDNWYLLWRQKASFPSHSELDMQLHVVARISACQVLPQCSRYRSLSRFWSCMHGGGSMPSEHHTFDDLPLLSLPH
eukprot:3976642-Amphidinium_carterae.1